MYEQQGQANLLSLDCPVCMARSSRLFPVGARASDRRIEQMYLMKLAFLPIFVSIKLNSPEEMQQLVVESIDLLNTSSSKSKFKIS